MLTRYLFIIPHRQTKLDCELLEDEGIMDYSLMLGLQVKGSCQGRVKTKASHVFILAK